MTQMITRCPACGTRFRITEAQLNTAKGAVRCGSCLQIFRALDNRVSDLNAEPAPAQDKPASSNSPQPAVSPPQSSSTQPQAPDQTLATSASASGGASGTVDFTAELPAEDDDILISDEMPLDDGDEDEKPSLLDEDFSDNFLEVSGWKASPKSLFEREPKAADEDDDSEDKEDLDESWAINLLEEEHEKAKAEPASTATPAERRMRAVTPSASQPNHSYSPPALEMDHNLDEPDHLEPDFGSAVDEFDALFDGEGENLIRERRTLLSGIQPEPVEFSSYQGRNWRRLLLWGGLSLLGLVVLIGQIAWFQFDFLSRHQPYRSLYTAVCPLLKCQVPTLAAPELIRTSNLVVRSHPQAADALVVDTILLNTASFQQPFPELTLTFSNRHGETVASRRFQPQEYLAGELAGRQLMPSNQPIHLTLEILDPGPEAVSYSAFIPH